MYLKFVAFFPLFICMKCLLFVFSIVFGLSAQAQDGYVFTKIQHEQIKKNLQDYKILIKDYKFLDHRYDSLKNAFQFLKKQHSNQIIEFEKLQFKYQYLKRENTDFIFYTLENEKLKKQNESLKHELDYKNKALYNYKRKYEREHRLTRGDRIIGNAVLGIFVMCGMWGIYTSIEANHSF